MNAVTEIKAETGGLALLRVPFAPNQISKLPKPTKTQTDAVKADFKKGVRCQDCGSWHHPDVIHLDYVGHAAATDRLLDADPRWTWEPVPDPASMGLPTVQNGMWIKLTVDGVSRYGFGCADGKSGGDAIKEIIGDAIRNAGMRFGMALDLWHKGDLHGDDVEPNEPKRKAPPEPDAGAITDRQRQELMDLAVAKGIDAKTLCEVGGYTSIKEIPAAQFERAKTWIAKQPAMPVTEAAQSSDILDDEIPF